jgi:hypothetical protein
MDNSGSVLLLVLVGAAGFFAWQRTQQASAAPLTTPDVGATVDRTAPTFTTARQRRTDKALRAFDIAGGVLRGVSAGARDSIQSR